MAAPTSHDPHATDAAHATTGAEGHASGGLPQFQTQHWAGQMGYLLILFFLLYFLIAKVFAPRLRRVLDERAETISSAVATARSVQAEAAGFQNEKSFIRAFKTWTGQSPAQFRRAGQGLDSSD